MGFPSSISTPRSIGRRRVCVLGATGTIGRATVAALVRRGHEVVCPVRPASCGDARRKLPDQADIRTCAVTDPVSLAQTGFRGERFDALVSCMASRKGTPRDAWAIDYEAHSGALTVARNAGVPHMVLLSAICVQRPRLAFQHAKLAFEEELVRSGLRYSIVRPTAYFKSLSGQVDRVRRGKPYLLFGDGRLTACKPISDRDLGEYLAGCLDDAGRQDRILPIGDFNQRRVRPLEAPANITRRSRRGSNDEIPCSGAARRHHRRQPQHGRLD